MKRFLDSQMFILIERETAFLTCFSYNPGLHGLLKTVSLYCCPKVPVQAQELHYRDSHLAASTLGVRGVGCRVLGNELLRHDWKESVCLYVNGWMFSHVLVLTKGGLLPVHPRAQMQLLWENLESPT